MDPDAPFHLRLGPPALPALCCRCACAQPNLCPASWTHCRPIPSFCLLLLPAAPLDGPVPCPGLPHGACCCHRPAELLGSVLGQLPARHSPRWTASPCPLAMAKVSSLGLWLRILIRRKCGLKYQSFLQDKLFLTHLALKGFWSVSSAQTQGQTQGQVYWGKDELHLFLLLVSWKLPWFPQHSVKHLLNSIYKFWKVWRTKNPSVGNSAKVSSQHRLPQGRVLPSTVRPLLPCKRDCSPHKVSMLCSCSANKVFLSALEGLDFFLIAQSKYCSGNIISKCSGHQETTRRSDACHLDNAREQGREGQTHI